MEYHYVKFNSDKEVTIFFEELNKRLILHCIGTLKMG